MTSYLVGGAGVLVGVVVALIYMLKYRSVKGKYDLLSKDDAILKKAYQKLIDDHENSVKRLENENQTLKDKNDEIRENIRTIQATCSNPVELNRAINRLFPMPKEGGEGPG
jgi:predicted RNase H-like nuclease (RuvC/YqgF family)